MNIQRCFVSILLVLSTSSVYGWGERGHDLVARVAVRSLAEDPEFKSAKAAFVKKEHMLGHLANVPDIVWRSQGKAIVTANASTHFVDLEYIDPAPTFEGLPRTIREAEARVTTLCKKANTDYICPKSKNGTPRIDDVGSAPWRIRQMFQLMTSSLRDAGKKDGRKRIKDIDRALLFAGILAHFVADLANPYHNTRDYDGWERGQGGIHGYFETELVNTLDLTLDQAVLEHVQKKNPLPLVAAVLPDKQRLEKMKDPLEFSLALSIESLKHLDEVFSLDKTHALLKKSRMEKGMKLKAKRKDPQEVAPYFRDIIIGRLATAAASLAHLWKTAWIEAGRPDLTDYYSYTYPVAPKFIVPDYLPKI